MVCQRRSCQIVVRCSLLNFGIACKRLWELIFPSAPPITPQTDGQTERVNQVLEDMLRACVLSYGKNWEKCLPFAEFSYNNSFQASLGMTPIEALYERRCRTPLTWSETCKRLFFDPDSINEAEIQVQLSRDRLRTAQPDRRAMRIVVIAS